MYGNRSQLIEHLARAPICMVSVLIFLTAQEDEYISTAARLASKVARKQGLRSSHLGIPIVQALGPVRPLILPADANRRSRHIALRAAVGPAVRTAHRCSGLGWISTIDVDALEASILEALSENERETLCLPPSLP